MGYRYDLRVEETLSIKQRTVRDRVRLMLLFKEAENHHRLSSFTEDTGFTPMTAQNYLSAYSSYVKDRLLPNRVTDADDVSVSDDVYELWADTFDPTLHDSRYQMESRAAVLEAAGELGLKGHTKALDIAKNPRSMIAAILGDSRAADAALQGLFKRLEKDRIVRGAIQEKARDLDHTPHPVLDRITDTERCQAILSRIDQETIRLSEYDVPSSMTDFVVKQISVMVDRLLTVKTVLEARHDIENMDLSSM